ncbi:acyltransferase family protein [Patescibacteria group bacterium]|nr:acyltransferase family protein [Patescibacteria group bacterium]
MRNPVFDVLRFLLIIPIVSLHMRIIMGASSGNPLEPVAWYTVPVFIILSFYFRRKKPLAVRLQRLIIPFLFWSAVGFLISPRLVSVRNGILQLTTGQIVDTPLYYLLILASFTLIAKFMDMLPRLLTVLLYAGIVLGAFTLEYSGLNARVFSPKLPAVARTYGRFAELIVFVPAGLAFSWLAGRSLSRLWLMLVPLAFLILSALAAIILPGTSGFHFGGLPVAFGASAIFSVFLFLSDMKLPNRVSAAFLFLGKYTFGVYLTHYLIILSVVTLIPQAIPFISGHYAVSLLLFLFLSYTFAAALDRGTMGHAAKLVS